MRTGAGVFRIDLLRALDDVENDLTDRARLVLRELYADLLKLEDRIKSVSTGIKDIADADETARRLITSADEDPRRWGPRGNGDPGRYRRSVAVPKSTRCRCVAGVGTQAAFDRRKANTAEYRQAR